MTPHRSGGRGTLIIDRRYHGVGRIKRASGTNEAKVFRKILDMLDEIAGAGRTDVLRDIRDGILHPLEVWNAYRQHGVHRLPTAERLRPLQSAVEEWLKTAEIAAKTRRDYAYVLNGVTDTAPSTTPITKLPKLLAAYRYRAKPRMFNLARSACQAFIRDTVGRYHELWVEVANVRPRKVRAKRGNPQTPEEARTITQSLGRYGGMWWTMCCTGMGPNEYWDREWEILEDRIVIHGTKREGRSRVAPRITSPVRALILYPAFRRHLLDATDGTVRPYDARRSFAHWLEEAGIPRTRRRQYLGHGRRDVTDIYEDFPVERYVGQDARRLEEYLGGEPRVLEVMQ
jgi:integrase